MYLFFGLDDTLLDTTSAVQQATLGFAAIYPGILGSDAMGFCTSWRNLADHYYDKWTKGEITFSEQRRCRIRYFFGNELSDEEADRIFDVYLSLYTGHWAAFPDVLPTLAQIPEYTLAILTNGDPEQQRAKLVELGISERFPLLVTPMDAGVCKPDKRIFRYAANQIGGNPAECLYIGDQLDSDARAAKNAGWHGIWLDRACNDRQVTDVPVIHTLAELPELFAHMIA
ncbi:MAG: HAD family hydrolase [Anaerolineae bacterium]